MADRRRLCYVPLPLSGHSTSRRQVSRSAPFVARSGARRRRTSMGPTALAAPVRSTHQVARALAVYGWRLSSLPLVQTWSASIRMFVSSSLAIPIDIEVRAGHMEAIGFGGGAGVGSMALLIYIWNMTAANLLRRGGPPLCSAAFYCRRRLSDTLWGRCFASAGGAAASNQITQAGAGHTRKRTDGPHLALRLHLWFGEWQAATGHASWRRRLLNYHRSGRNRSSVAPMT